MDPVGDQPLGLAEHRARLLELARGGGAAREHLRQRLGRRLQHRQEIARRVGQALLRAARLAHRAARTAGAPPPFGRFFAPWRRYGNMLRFCIDLTLSFV